MSINVSSIVFDTTLGTSPKIKQSSFILQRLLRKNKVRPSLPFFPIDGGLVFFLEEPKCLWKVKVQRSLKGSRMIPTRQ